MSRCRTLALSLAIATSTGCSLASSVAHPVDAGRRMDRATAALSRDDFLVAEEELAWLASRCDTGGRGRTALLLLAAAELDPANPTGNVDDAAYLSASYLQLPSVPEAEAHVARTLYRLALDRGAEPVDRMPLPTPGDFGASGEARAGSIAAAPEVAASTTEGGTAGGTGASMSAGAPGSAGAPAEPSAVQTAAARLQGCNGPGAASGWRSLPRPLELSNADRIEALERSLEVREDSEDGLRAALAASRERVADLEAEIERIRELLTEPVLPPGPGGER